MFGFSETPIKSIPLSILKPLGVEALASPNYLLSRSYRSGEGRLITEILVGGGAPHNGDFGRRKNGTSPLFLNALGQLTDGWGHLGRWLQVGGGGASWGV